MRADPDCYLATFDKALRDHHYNGSVFHLCHLISFADCCVLLLISSRIPAIYVRPIAPMAVLSNKNILSIVEPVSAI